MIRVPQLPAHVKNVKAILSKDPSNELNGIAKKLFDGTPELTAMWNTLHKVSRENDLIDEDPLQHSWVVNFLEHAKYFSEPPAFHKKNAEARRTLSRKIEKLAKAFSTALIVNGLDSHLVYIDDSMFDPNESNILLLLDVLEPRREKMNFFHTYEDCTPSAQAEIDASGRAKIKMSGLILDTAKKLKERIAEEPQAGKQGNRAMAIRFIRSIAKRNMSLYEDELRTETATAANAIFGTAYGERDVDDLLDPKRAPKPRKPV